MKTDTEKDGCSSVAPVSASEDRLGLAEMAHVLEQHAVGICYAKSHRAFLVRKPSQLKKAKSADGDANVKEKLKVHLKRAMHFRDTEIVIPDEIGED